MSPKANRNDPCPCGSNKKYKNCCGKKGIRLNARLFKRVFLGVVIIVAAAWAGKQYIFVADSEQSSDVIVPNQQPRRVQPLVPQPPGPAPAGKVWSPEHGHWHDAPTTGADGKPIFTPKPQPPGLPPPGKVWSYEHGHWHDTSYTGNENFTPGPPPPGPAPEGKVWSYEHGHWHDDPGQASAPGQKPASIPATPSKVTLTPKPVQGGD